MSSTKISGTYFSEGSTFLLESERKSAYIIISLIRIVQNRIQIMPSSSNTHFVLKYNSRIKIRNFDSYSNTTTNRILISCLRSLTSCVLASATFLFHSRSLVLSPMDVHLCQRYHWFLSPVTPGVCQCQSCYH